MSKLSKITLEEIKLDKQGSNLGHIVNIEIIDKHPIQVNNLPKNKLFKTPISQRIIQVLGTALLLSCGLGGSYMMLIDETPFNILKIVSSIIIIMCIIGGSYWLWNLLFGPEAIREILIDSKSITLARKNKFYWCDINEIQIKRFNERVNEGTSDYILMELKDGNIVKYEITYLKDNKFLKYNYHGELAHFINLYYNIS